MTFAHHREGAAIDIVCSAAEKSIDARRSEGSLALSAAAATREAKSVTLTRRADPGALIVEKRMHDRSRRKGFSPRAFDRQTLGAGGVRRDAQKGSQSSSGAFPTQRIESELKRSDVVMHDACRTRGG